MFTLNTVKIFLSGLTSVKAQDRCLEYSHHNETYQASNWYQCQWLFVSIGDLKTKWMGNLFIIYLLIDFMSVLMNLIQHNFYLDSAKTVKFINLTLFIDTPGKNSLPLENVISNAVLYRKNQKVILSLLFAAKYFFRKNIVLIAMILCKSIFCMITLPPNYGLYCSG